MTILGPVLMASMMIVPIYISTMSSGEKTVAIVDESGFFTEGFNDSKKIHFKTVNMAIEEAKKNYDKLGADLILYIPQPAYTFPSHVILFSKKQDRFTAKNSTSFHKAGIANAPQ